MDINKILEFIGPKLFEIIQEIINSEGKQNIVKITDNIEQNKLLEYYKEKLDIELLEKYGNEKIYDDLYRVLSNKNTLMRLLERAQNLSVIDEITDEEFIEIVLKDVPIDIYNRRNVKIILLHIAKQAFKSFNEFHDLDHNIMKNVIIRESNLIIHKLDNVEKNIDVMKGNIEKESNYNNQSENDQFNIDTFRKVNIPFIKKMEMPLFLEKSNMDNNIRTLKDVYVAPRFRNSEINCNTKRFSEELRSNKSESILTITDIFETRPDISSIILKGLPGSGKSSFIAYLIDQYYKEGKLFGYRKVFAISLLSLAKYSGGRKLASDPIKCILDYISICVEYKVEYSLLKDSVILLDGLDEICFIENLSIDFFCEDLINKSIFNDEVYFRILLTSRLGYIDCKNKNVCQITIDNFQESELIEFRDKYFKKDKDTIKLDIFNENLNYVKENSQYTEIFGIPLILYIITSSKLYLSEYDDICSIYEALLHVLETREYNRKISKSEQQHPIYNIVSPEMARNIAQNIAFEMMIENSLILRMEDLKSKEAINASTQNSGIVELPYESKEKIENLYLLTFYYKDEHDIVEFVHRSFQEFFAAEKIVLELLNSLESENMEIIGQAIREYFGGGVITSEIFSFIESKVKRLDLKKKKRMFLVLKSGIEDNINNNIPWFLPSKKKDFWDNMGQQYLMIWNILKILNNYKNVGLFEKSNIQRKWLRMSLTITPNSKMPIHLENENMSNINLMNVCLKNSIVTGAIFWGAKMYNINLQTDLNNCVFSYTSIIDSNISGRNLKNVKFIFSNLTLSDFSNAYFENNRLIYTKFVEMNLQKAIFISCDLSESLFWGWNLSDAVFVDCKLKNTNFITAKVDNAYFNGCKGISTEQKKFLLSNGAVIQEV